MSNGGVEAGSTDELSRLISLLLRQQKTQSDLIVELDSVGISAKRIADLTGATPAVVSQTLYVKRKGKKRRKL